MKDGTRKQLLVMAQERVADTYRPGSVKPLLENAKVLESKVKQPSNFILRYDIMIPLGIARPGSTTKEILQDGVTAKVELSKGERVDVDRPLDEKTLLIFWTTFYMTPYGELFHERENGAWMSVGQMHVTPC